MPHWMCDSTPVGHVVHDDNKDDFLVPRQQRLYLLFAHYIDDIVGRVYYGLLVVEYCLLIAAHAVVTREW